MRRNHNDNASNRLLPTPVTKQGAGKQDMLREGGNFSLRVIELKVLLTSELEMLATWVQVEYSREFQVGARVILIKMNEAH